MKRLSLLAWILWALPILAGQGNIVLVVADDLGCDVGCYGHPVVKTPNLDRLAAEGTRFTHAFCTTASCSPSRSVLLTGKYNHATGMYGLQHATHHFQTFDDVASLPVLLHDAGYRTARVGKFHVGPDPVFKFDQVLTPAPGSGGGRPNSPVGLADACRDFVTKSDKPFFLYCCTTEPHRSGNRIENQPGRPNRFNNPAPGKAANTAGEVVYDPKDVPVPAWLPDTPASRAELAQYLQAASRFDAGLGRLVQHLKDAGVYDETLIVVLSDNGAPFPGGKTTLYDPGVRLPLIVRHPKTERRGLTSEAMVNWADITPTLLDFAGALKRPEQFHGRSFISNLHHDKLPGWDETFGSHTFHEITMYYPMRSIRTRTHKLIFNVAHGLPFPSAADLWQASAWEEALKAGPKTLYGQRTVDSYLNRPRFELYDLVNDPGETKNLANDPSQAPLLMELQAKLKEFQKRTADPWLLKWNRE